MVVALVLLGCDDPAGTGTGGIVASTFIAPDLVNAWTWRDDGDTGLVLDEALVRGRMDEDGRVEVRRGARYSAGTEVGAFVWDIVAADIILASWAWGSEGSSTPTVMALANSSDGEMASNGAGACTPQRYETVSTTYGTFPDALACVCVGAPAPDGTYWFAENFSMVKAETSVFTLDLVAPW